MAYSWGNLPEAKMSTSAGQILLGEDSLGNSCIFVCFIKELSVIHADLFKDVCRENNIEDTVFPPRAKIKHILTLKYNDDKISHWSKGQACLFPIKKY